MAACRVGHQDGSDAGLREEIAQRLGVRGRATADDDDLRQAQGPGSCADRETDQPAGFVKRPG